jgi:hypothetical protein
MKALPETRPDDGPVTRVKFIADYRYETEGRNKGPLFKKGAVYDFPDDLAQRFLKRNVAERVNKSEPVTDKYLVSAAPQEEEIVDLPKKQEAKSAGGPAKVDALTSSDFKKT